VNAYCPQLFNVPCAIATIQRLSVRSHSQPSIKPDAAMPGGMPNASLVADIPSMCWMPDSPKGTCYIAQMIDTRTTARAAPLVPPGAAAATLAT